MLTWLSVNMMRHFHVLDKHAPSKCIYVVDRPMNDWMTDDILVLKALRRKYESLWRKTPSIFDNIRAEFPLLEANLPSYSFLSMDSIMSMCPTGLYHFDPVTDIEL